MRGTKARIPLTTPVTLTPCTQLQSLGVVCHTLALGAPTPALLQSTWHPPKRSKTASASAVTESRLVTSVRKTMVVSSSWSSAATEASAVSSTSATTTRMPSSANARTIASPMPLAPPVTTATLSRRSSIPRSLCPFGPYSSRPVCALRGVSSSRPTFLLSCAPVSNDDTTWVPRATAFTRPGAVRRASSESRHVVVDKDQARLPVPIEMGRLL